MDPIIGQLCFFGFNFAPEGWALCDGSLVQISANNALFSLLRTNYGGDGKSTFGLPDLRGRFPMGMGPNNSIGASGGGAQITLTAGQMPAHNHALAASNTATSLSPSGLVPATTNDSAAGAEVSAYGAPDGTLLAQSACGLAGGGQPVNIMNPFVVGNWCIATTGIYPSPQ